MENILRFLRDDVTGIFYVVYALIILFFIFAIIGYMLTEKYQVKK